MTGTKLAVGFIPLVDAAPLIVAEELGFAAEEGLTLDLIRAPSWACNSWPKACVWGSAAC